MLVFSQAGLMDRTLCEKKNYTGSWDGIYLNVNDIDSRERSDMFLIIIVQRVICCCERISIVGFMLCRTFQQFFFVYRRHMFTIIDLFWIPFSCYFVIFNTIISPIHTKQDNNNLTYSRNKKLSCIKISKSGSAKHILKKMSLKWRLFLLRLSFYIIPIPQAGWSHR